MSPPIKIAIACQGGGSQTAFTAGALKALMQQQVGKQFRVVSVSGTSGGSLCATLAWYAAMKGEQPVYQRLMDFWHDNTARDAAEEMFNNFVISSLRAVNGGLMPSFQLSPSSPVMRMMMSGVSAMLPRKEFMDFETLLRKYIDFDEIAGWGPRLAFAAGHERSCDASSRGVLAGLSN